MLKWFSADLHIHTVLSPCAELDMGPINMKDGGKTGPGYWHNRHNSAANVAAVMARGGPKGSGGYWGVEVQTRKRCMSLPVRPDQLWPMLPSSGNGSECLIGRRSLVTSGVNGRRRFFILRNPLDQPVTPPGGGGG